MFYFSSWAYSFYLIKTSFSCLNSWISFENLICSISIWFFSSWNIKNLAYRSFIYYLSCNVSFLSFSTNIFNSIFSFDTFSTLFFCSLITFYKLLMFLSKQPNFSWEFFSTFSILYTILSAIGDIDFPSSTNLASSLMTIFFFLPILTSNSIIPWGWILISSKFSLISSKTSCISSKHFLSFSSFWIDSTVREMVYSSYV